MSDTDYLALDELYAALPSVQCIGKCQCACGPIDLTETEQKRIAEQGGITIPLLTAERATSWAETGKPVCPALGAFGQCRVHPVRPTICRLWGMTESMQCPFGCRPTRLLSNPEALQILLQAKSVDGGGSDQFAHEIDDMLHDPEIRELMGRLVTGDRSVEKRLVAAIARVRGQAEQA